MPSYCNKKKFWKRWKKIFNDWRLNYLTTKIQQTDKIETATASTAVHTGYLRIKKYFKDILIQIQSSFNTHINYSSKSWCTLPLYLHTHLNSMQPWSWCMLSFIGRIYAPSKLKMIFWGGEKWSIGSALCRSIVFKTDRDLDHNLLYRVAQKERNCISFLENNHKIYLFRL